MKSQQKQVVATQRRVPEAIWMPGTEIAMYRGSPIRMVEQMAEEMGPDVDASEAIDLLVKGLNSRRIASLMLPKEAPVALRARVFIAVLVATGVAQPMAVA